VFIAATATFEEARGGSARYVSGLRDGLQVAGASVTVRTSHGMLGRSADRPGIGGQVLRAVVRLSVVYPRITLAIVRSSPDVVTSHFALEGLAALVGARLTRRPLVSHFHGPWALEAAATGRRGGWPLSTRLRRRVETFVYRRSAAVITLSDAFAAILRDELGVQPERIRVIPGGIDLATWRDVPDRDAARQVLGVGDAFTVLSVRRLTRRMGLDLALRAVAAWDLDRTVRYLIVGDGEARGELQELAASLDLGARVTFLGSIPDDQLRRAYAAADVTLMPTRSLEGFGYAALESLAVGVPVVATAIGGLAELVGGLSPDLLIAPDAAAIAARLQDVCRKPEAYPDSSACRAYAAAFDWSLITQRVLEAYRAASAGSGGGR
jgi:glycosyltransferase involved in cell wall biosynthesis